MNLTTRRLLRGWLLALATATVLMAGCTSLSTTVGPADPGLHPVVGQAATLLENGGDAQQVNALLGQLDDASLAAAAAALPIGDPMYNYLARALLARGLPLPRPIDRTARGFDAAGRPPADRDGYRPPLKLGVLLPLTGDLAAPAAAVRDGFLTAYYAESRQRPEIAFYDTHGTTGGAASAYDKAVSAGSDFMVGPLSRDSVDALFRRGALPVPMLALNQGAISPPPGNVSFSLSPEEEGVAAADLMTARGSRRVMVIDSGDDNSRRSIDAFRARLGELGGVITDVVSAGIADLSPFAQKEGGVDAIYLAMRGPNARELMPRLAMAGLSGKPLVATSQLLSGTGKAEEDRVLDGIAFPTDAWTSGQTVRGLPSAASLGQTLPTARGAAARLFAFGYDAWLLSAYLERLAQSPDAHIAGATGALAIDSSGKVLRTPVWSTFRGGYTSPLPSAGN